MATPKIIADFETQLATALAVGGTSFTLASATDDDGVALPNGLYYFTVDSGISNKEYLAGTLSGTSVTSVVSVSRQGVETSGAARAHRVGASVLLTDFATYKKYMDEIALVSAPDASQTVKGVVETATLAEVRARTGTGGTGAALAVTPDVMDDLPTQDQKTFLAGVTGMIIPYGGASAPTGFLLCDGAAVSRTTYSALFAIISTAYGVGDGSTTFNIPNLKGRAPVGLDSAQTEFDALGETGGAKTHTLTVDEMPSHSHTADLTGGGSSSNTVLLFETLRNVSVNSTVVNSVGGDIAHNNLQPYITLNYIIKT